MSYATGMLPALQGLVAELKDAGVPADLDRGRMRVPGAWVRPDRVQPLSLAGDGRMRVSVFLVCQVGSDEAVLAKLTELLDSALEVVDPDEEVDTAVLVNVKDNALPGFRLVCDIDC